MDFSNAVNRLGDRIDLVKMDVEGAEIGILEGANASDLTSCVQLTVEFHDKRAPFTRQDVDRVCRRMRTAGYGIVIANWPKVDDVLFVNLKSVPVAERIRTSLPYRGSECLIHCPSKNLPERLQFVVDVCNDSYHIGPTLFHRARAYAPRVREINGTDCYCPGQRRTLFPRAVLRDCERIESFKSGTETGCESARWRSVAVVPGHSFEID